MSENPIIEIDYHPRFALVRNRLLDPAKEPEFVESLKNGQEVLAVIFKHPTIHGEFIVVDGNRRGMALASTGKKLRCELRPEPFTESLGRKIRLRANNSQKRVDAFAVAEDAERIMQLEGFKTQAQLAKFMGWTEATASKILGVSGVPIEFRELASKLHATTVRLIATLTHTEDMKTAFERAVGPPSMPKEKVEAMIAEMKAARGGKERKPPPIDAEFEGYRIRVWPSGGASVDGVGKAFRAFIAVLKKNPGISPTRWPFLFG